MDLKISILSEVSKTQKDKYHVISLMWNLKYDTGTSLVVQWLRIHLAMQGSRVQSLAEELRSQMLPGN